ncbi:hypothetical protein DXT99_25035 [Pontibacter diazotrophicus]|uniref:Uncharacterized protein n=1 Tax=Pontibacter diazotrophicus TaxID=1400979 RepID=A0A3D8L1K2_9BACT|nr:hypothetical protein [Pontibacter diazotrophicus]RDV11301.1 hypothetical protein DXT99_25035 [Pontibacter diazotrophicus]
MKNLKVAFAMVAVAMFTFLSANDAKAQQNANVGQAVAGLINVNIGAVQVDVELDNVLNDFTLVNVEDVLNDAEINILNNVLNNSPILSNNSEILTNLLRDADIIEDNQVVVGVLSGGSLLIQ